MPRAPFMPYESSSFERKSNYSSHSKTTSHLNPTSFAKLKNSGNYALPFSVPSLYINKKPEDLRNINAMNDEQEFALNDYDESLLIAINIDIEQIHNEMNVDKTYNRKLLGPLKPIRFPLIIDCKKCVEDDNDIYFEKKKKKKYKTRHKKSRSLIPLPSHFNLKRTEMVRRSVKIENNKKKKKDKK